MKRVLLGVPLVACGLVLTLASAGTAAEIPPTAECSDTFGDLYKVNQEEISEGVTDREERQSARRFIEGLAEAGCISDAEPLLKKVPVTPFSAECVTAAMPGL